MLSEVQCSHEINALEKRFDSWTDSNQVVAEPRGAVTKLPSARDIAKNLPPEVAQFSVCFIFNIYIESETLNRNL